MKRTRYLLAIVAVISIAACNVNAVSGLGGGMGEGECVGDEDTWAQITLGPFVCEKNTDCCVIASRCHQAAQIVRASDFEVGKTAWPSCGEPCERCGALFTRVGCVDGRCAVEAIDWMTVDQNPELSAFALSHCGRDGDAVTKPSGKELLTCSD